MPRLNDFIAALTQEQANLVQMVATKHSKNQALATTDAPKSSGRDKQKGKVNLMNRRRRDPYNL